MSDDWLDQHRSRVLFALWRCLGEPDEDPEDFIPRMKALVSTVAMSMSREDPLDAHWVARTADAEVVFVFGWDELCLGSG